MNYIKRLLAYLFLFLLCITPTKNTSAATKCDCHGELTWIKKTFEKNDAGFDYILKEKGQRAYEAHTAQIMQTAKDIKTKSECMSLIYEWLRFFRKGHLGVVDLNEEKKSTPIIDIYSSTIARHEKLSLSDSDFHNLIDNEKEPSPIGIWESSPYKVGIVPTDNGYTGFVLDAPGSPWKKKQIKFKLYRDGKGYRATLWMRDFTAKENRSVNFIGNNLIHIEGMSFFIRKSKTFEDTPLIKNYINYIFTNTAYYEQLPDKTSYVRIPSFAMSNKRVIDSILSKNHEKIITNPNLIIDLRDNGGGADIVYSSLIPYIYTNPIRTVGVELLSTELNNNALLELSKDTLYDEMSRKEFKYAYDKLNLKLGSFVRLKNDIVTIKTIDSIFPNPKRVAILVNENCGSTTEQFLLEAKQSNKVKLYGKTTFGALDISNMHHVNSPSGEFQLWYCRSKSLRIPEMAIDNKGLQPDYYLDNSIPQKDWIEFVLKTFN